MRTFLTCERAIAIFKENIEDIRKQFDSLKRIRSVRTRADVDLNLLANSLLKTSIDCPTDNTSSRKSTASANSPEISKKKLAILREYFMTHQPKVVEPLRPSSASESAVISRLNEIFEQSRIEDTNRTYVGRDSIEEMPKGLKPKSIEAAPRESLGAALGLRASATMSTPLKPPMNSTFISSGNASALPCAAPKYSPRTEPVTPPDQVASHSNVNKNPLDSLSACKPFAFEEATAKTATTFKPFSFAAPTSKEGTQTPAFAFNVGSGLLSSTKLDFSVLPSQTGAIPKVVPKAENKSGVDNDQKTITAPSTTATSTSGGMFNFKSELNPAISFASFSTTDVFHKNKSTSAGQTADKEKAEATKSVFSTTPSTSSSFSFNAASFNFGTAQSSGNKSTVLAAKQDDSNKNIGKFGLSVALPRILPHRERFIPIIVDDNI